LEAGCAWSEARCWYVRSSDASLYHRFPLNENHGRGTSSFNLYHRVRLGRLAPEALRTTMELMPIQALVWLSPEPTVGHLSIPYDNAQTQNSWQSARYDAMRKICHLSRLERWNFKVWPTVPTLTVAQMSHLRIFTGVR
jgi:hypothetical protein